MIKYIKIYDLLGFKLCWLACAFCTQWGHPYLGSLITLFFILIHLLIVKFKKLDIKIIFFAIICGFLIDSFLFRFEFIIYEGGVLARMGFAPLWILSMWAGFSITLLYTLNKIREKYFISGLLGAIGGPLSYSAGVSIGSLNIISSYSYILLALFWGLIIPFLFFIINRLDADV